MESNEVQILPNRRNHHQTIKVIPISKIKFSKNIESIIEGGVDSRDSAENVQKQSLPPPPPQGK
jgi:uncharacterized pyridoxal phosphate-containing UPF0001 family protein